MVNDVIATARKDFFKPSRSTRILSLLENLAGDTSQSQSNLGQATSMSSAMVKMARPRTHCPIMPTAVPAAAPPSARRVKRRTKACAI